MFTCVLMYVLRYVCTYVFATVVTVVDALVCFSRSVLSAGNCCQVERFLLEAFRRVIHSVITCFVLEELMLF